ncbi:MAG: UDP-N-acetylmuramate dehydrogenase [Candidatus Margulisbacteria bacterium]|nr:UDP-N-acetylmuramate dehydrogenase [Candidatus Margulisiibacteriota bacterium]
MKFQRNEPLKKHTSLRIGGLADYFFQPKNIEELAEALELARKNKLPVAVLGGGTNLLVLEQGFRGLVIKLGRGLNTVTIEGSKIRVGAGVLLPNLIVTLAKKGVGGLEFLAGVPGSVGGAVVMNAGAWGKEIGQYVAEVRVLDHAGQEKVLKKSKLKLGYRSSLFQNSNWILTEVLLNLRRKKPKLIKERLLYYLTKRRASQPLGIPNCGSVFKNPKNDYAGRLIEAAGCKGLRIGDAQVSVKHANFIVNLGEANAKDVIKIMTRVQKAVKERFKILLEPEVKIMVKSAT